MGIGTALVIAASGLAVVFLMLALLWASIIVVSKVVNKVAPAKAAAPAAPAAAPAPAAPAAGTFGGDVALIDVDEKTAACVMAIVSHETGIPLSELIFKKIKAL